MKIGAKVTLAFGAVLALEAINALIVASEFARLEQSVVSLVGTTAPASNALQEMETSGANAVNAVLQYVAAPDAALRERLEEVAADFARSADRYRELARDQPDHAFSEEAATVFAGLTSLGGELMSLADRRSDAEERLRANSRWMHRLLAGEPAPAGGPATERPTTPLGQQMEAKAAETVAAAAAYARTRDPAMRDRLRSSLAGFRSVLDAYRAQSPPKGRKAWLDQVEGAFGHLQAATAEIVVTADALRTALGELRGRAERLTEILDDHLQPLIQAAMARADQEARETARFGRAMLIAVSLIAALIALGAGAYLVRGIVAPLRKLANAAADIGTGALGTRVAVYSQDELGMVARAMDRMAHDLSAATVSRGHVDAILRSVSEVILVLDLNGAVRTANAAALSLTGFAEEELTGRPLEVLLLDNAQCEDLLKTVFSTGSVRGREAVLRTLGGDPIPVLLNASLMYTAGGKVEGIVVDAADFTERRRVELALRDSERRFRDLAEVASDWFWETDHDLRLIYASPSFPGLQGGDIEAAVGQPLWQLLDGDPTTDEAWRRHRQDLLLRRPFQNFRCQMTLEGDEVRHLKMSGLPIVDETGTFRGYRGAGSDETLEVERALELERSNAELEAFAFVASHDLQEPLRMVASYTQLLGERYRGRLDEDADAFIGFAVDGANRMREMIDALLIYSRTGSTGICLEPTDCDAVLGTVRENLAAALEETGATVESGPLPTIRADTMQMVQLFQNLVGNAIKYRGDAAPVIRISAERTGDRWTFCVADNGIGIDADSHGRIFRMFQRLHTRTEYAGTGLGLTLCKRIVERHGGRIWVESDPGAGARFRFTIRERGETEDDVVDSRTDRHPSGRGLSGRCAPDVRSA